MRYIIDVGCNIDKQNRRTKATDIVANEMKIMIS